jgi:peptidyl-tRNA hydrolase
MACINGLPCLELKDDALWYTSTQNKLTLFPPLSNYTKEEIFSVINEDLCRADISLGTEDRLTFEAIIAKYSIIAERYIFAQQAINDVVSDFERYKMYVVVRSDIGLGHSVNCVGHATNRAEATWNDDLEYQRWKQFSFKKVTCKANRSKFEDLKKHGDYIVISEDVLNDVEVAIIFKPRAIWHEDFKKLRMFE